MKVSSRGHAYDPADRLELTSPSQWRVRRSSHPPPGERLPLMTDLDFENPSPPDSPGRFRGDGQGVGVVAADDAAPAPYGSASEASFRKTCSRGHTYKPSGMPPWLGGRCPECRTAAKSKFNARRIYVGALYCGAAATPELANRASEHGLTMLWDSQAREYREFRNRVSLARFEKNHAARVRYRAVANERDREQVYKLLQAWT
jgi:hypothetical protein